MHVASQGHVLYSASQISRTPVGLQSVSYLTVLYIVTELFGYFTTIGGYG